MPLYTYDASQVSVTVNGVPMKGAADGVFCSVEYAEDAFTKVKGTQGETSRSKSNDYSGVITITLMQTSPSNDILSALHALDRAQNAGVCVVNVVDNSGRSNHTATKAWIRRGPASAYGKEIENREWVFDCDVLTDFIGGNTES